MFLWFDKSRAEGSVLLLETPNGVVLKKVNHLSEMPFKRALEYIINELLPWHMIAKQSIVYIGKMSAMGAMQEKIIRGFFPKLLYYLLIIHFRGRTYQIWLAIDETSQKGG